MPLVNSRKFSPIIDQDLDPNSVDTSVLGSVVNFDPSQDAPSLNEEVNFIPKEVQRVDYNHLISEKFLLKWSDLDEYLLGRIVGEDNVKILDQRILERIKLYNDKIALQLRLAISKDLPHIKMLQIGDLEAPWDRSALKIALFTDAEIANLTLEDVKKMSGRQIEILKRRTIEGLEQVSVVIPENFNTVKLSELCSIPGGKLSDYLHEIPANMFFLLTETQLDQLDIFKLNDDQFKYVFSNTRRLRQLPIENLEKCIGRLAQLLPNRLSALAEEQVRSLNFGTQSSITPEILKQIAKVNYGIQPIRYKGALIGCLTTQQIIDGLNHGRFVEETSQYITSNQIMQIDFNDVKILDGRVIKSMFNREGNVASIKLGSVNILVPHIIPERLNRLNQDQIKILNFKKNGPITPAVLNGMIKLSYNPPQIYEGHVMQFLEAEQIIDGLSYGTLTPEASQFFTSLQIRQVDFSKVIDIKNIPGIQNVVRMMFYGEGKVVSIQKESINLVVPYIMPERLNRLDKDQVCALDFTGNGPITPAVLNGMIKLSYNPPQIYEGHAIQFLEAQQIVDGLSCGTLTSEASQFITAKQIEQTDFTKAKKFDFGVIENMFKGDGKVSSIQIGSVNTLIPHIIPEKLNRLSEDQVRVLDFKKNGPITPEVLRGMTKLSYNPPQVNEGHVIQFLGAQQIVVGLSSGTLTKDAAQYITAHQIGEIDFRLVKDIKFDPSNKDRIEAIYSMFYSEGKVSSIQNESINLVVPYIMPERLNRLRKDQVKALDFTEKGPITQSVFNGMTKLSYNPPQINEGHVIQFLTSDQLTECIKRSIFNTSTIQYIKEDQLRELALDDLGNSALVQKLKERKSKLK